MTAKKNLVVNYSEEEVNRRFVPISEPGNLARCVVYHAIVAADDLIRRLKVTDTNISYTRRDMRYTHVTPENVAQQIRNWDRHCAERVRAGTAQWIGDLRFTLRQREAEIRAAGARKRLSVTQRTKKRAAPGTPQPRAKRAKAYRAMREQQLPPVLEP